VSTKPDWQTQRRLRALELYQKGWPQKTIAEALGVTKGAVSQWIKRAKELPPDASVEELAQALRVKKSTGRPPAIGPQQRRELVALVECGPEALGFVGDVWTANRVRALAQRELGLRVGVSTIKKFLHAAGFSVQKPEVAATQKNEKAVAGFRGGWVNLKKGQSGPARP
jgi:transposase